MRLQAVRAASFFRSTEAVDVALTALRHPTDYYLDYTLDATFAALADPTRRAILARLSRGECSVKELAGPFEMSLPAVSKHLKVLQNAGLTSDYQTVMNSTLATVEALPAPASHYLLPFGARSRFLFKMDFAEAEYISRVRSGVKGHFSYRKIAWDMKCAMERLEPELGRLLHATPPWIEDPLQR